MAIVWNTDGILGSYSVDYPFNTDPVTISFSADPYSTVSLISGELPLGLSWDSYPNYIRLVGDAAPLYALTQYFTFVFRVTEPSGTYSERSFTIEMLNSPVPEWITPSNLGTYYENYSFNINPLNLEYRAERTATVRLLNGSFPEGLLWSYGNGNVTITSSVINVSTATDWEWTLRVTNPSGTIADRTYRMRTLPVADKPEWNTQPFELGYVTSNQFKKFTVTATVTGNAAISYSNVSVLDSRIAINSITGEIFFDNTNVTVVSDANIDIMLRATSSSGAYSDKLVRITLVTLLHNPIWITSSTLYTVQQGTYLKFPLETYVPNNSPVQYKIVSASTGFPFLIDSDGLLYGDVPFVEKNQLLTITVNAYTVGTTLTYATNRTFNLQIARINQEGVLNWRNPENEILNVSDGGVVVFDVGATSTSGRTVKHGITGGQTPPGIILDKVQGCLVGFVDYHCVDKDYYFDIWASDDVNTLVRTIHMQVNANFGYQFSEISIPLEGDIKQRWLSTVNFIMTNGEINPNSSVTGNTLYQPKMSLIKGLDNTIENVSKVLSKLWPSLERMKLSIGGPDTAVVNSNLDMLLYRDILDSQEGTAYEIPYVNTYTGYLTRPASLNNLRQSFTDVCKFANSGRGLGTTAVVMVNPEDGCITNVSIVTPGSGYVNHPRVTAVGSGTGATFRSYLTLTGIKVIDKGTNWAVGEHYTFNMGEYSVPAEFVVVETTGAGGLLSVKIVTGGNYSHAPIGKVWIKNSEGILTGIDPDFGVASVDVVSGGSGYVVNETQVHFAGTEILPTWLDEWKPVMPIALATPSFANTVINNSELAITKVLDGVFWQIGDLEWSVQGLFYQGSTDFSIDDLSFDGASTSFKESQLPQQTVFDQTNLTFDTYGTTFDIGAGVTKDARINWGKTVIDEAMTAFDFYSTIFDIAKAPMESLTTIRRLIPLQNFPQPFIPTPTGPTGTTGPTAPTGPVPIHTYWIGKQSTGTSNIFSVTSSLDAGNNIITAFLNGLVSKVNVSNGLLTYTKQLSWIDAGISADDTIISAIATDVARSMIMSISNENFIAFSSSAIVKFNQDFSIKWQISIDVPYIESIAVLNDSSIVAVSILESDLSSKLNVFKIKTSGTLEWQKQINNGTYTSAKVSRSINDLVLAASNQNYIDVIKLDTNGNVIWKHRINDEQLNQITKFDLTTDKSSNVYITIFSRPLVGFTNSTVCKLDSNGNLMWQKLIEGYFVPEGRVYVEPAGISIDYSGNTCVSGQIVNPSILNQNGEAILLKFDNAGNTLWQRKLSNLNPEGYINLSKSRLIHQTASAIYALGDIWSNTGYRSGLVANLPLDGSKTGTYSNIAYSGTQFSIQDAYLSIANSNITISSASHNVSSATITIVDTNFNWSVTLMP